MSVLSITLAAISGLAYLLVAVAFIAMSIGELTAKRRLDPSSLAKAILGGALWPLTLCAVLWLRAPSEARGERMPMRPTTIRRA